MKDQELFDKSDADFVLASKCPLTVEDTIEKLTRVRLMGIISVACFGLVFILGGFTGTDWLSTPGVGVFAVAGAILGVSADLKIKVLKCLHARERDDA
jgi:hypothetical protein